MCEEELIRRSQAGDWSAFERLVERYRTVLTRTAYLMTRDRESVQDVMQEALVQVWRDLPSYRPIGSFKSWMLNTGKQSQEALPEETGANRGVGVSGRGSGELGGTRGDD